MTVELKTGISEYVGEARRACTLCGTTTLKAEVVFKTGATNPGGVGVTVAETITGGTSADTGVVEQIILTSGTWAAGTAKGYMSLTSPTGLDSDGHWGTDGETVTSTGGTFVLDGEGTKKVDGYLYPESELVEFRGRWYCKPHFHFRWRQTLLDERTIILPEERGNE